MEINSLIVDVLLLRGLFNLHLDVGRRLFGSRRLELQGEGGVVGINLEDARI